MKDVIRQEYEFDKKRQEFDDEHNKIVSENDTLQEQLDKYCMEKEKFDRHAQ